MDNDKEMSTTTLSDQLFSTNTNSSWPLTTNSTSTNTTPGTNTSQFGYTDSMFDDSLSSTSPSSHAPSTQMPSHRHSLSAFSSFNNQNHHPAPPMSPPYISSSFTSLEQTIDSLSPAPNHQNNNNNNHHLLQHQQPTPTFLDGPFVPSLSNSSTLSSISNSSLPHAPPPPPPPPPQQQQQITFTQPPPHPNQTNLHTLTTQPPPFPTGIKRSSPSHSHSPSSSSSGSPSNKPYSRVPPKPKFSPDDDTLLIHLKENSNLTWRQIAQHFDGRSAGALQVRYCTKLKNRANSWSEDEEVALKQAIDEYESERWSIIAQKLDNKYTPTACREKFKQMNSSKE